MFNEEQKQIIKTCSIFIIMGIAYLTFGIFKIFSRMIPGWELLIYFDYFSIIAGLSASISSFLAMIRFLNYEKKNRLKIKFFDDISEDRLARGVNK